MSKPQDSFGNYKPGLNSASATTAAPGSPTQYWAQSAATDPVKSSGAPGRLYEAIFNNGTGSTIYLMLFDAGGGGSPSLPQDTDEPLLFKKLAAGETEGFHFNTGLPMVNGVCIAVSSTDDELTTLSNPQGLVTGIVTYS